MNILRQEGTQVELLLEAEEAARLLEGLQAFAAELGEEAAKLHEALASAGVRPPLPPDHIRHEY